jgi:uracil-DNA glycosylase family 4
MTLGLVEAKLKGCTHCQLHRKRNSIVFGAGKEDANIVLVGEAPGEQEDLQGKPFVGPSGHLLDRLLGKAGLTRQDVYITNIVKCRPPDNRDPDPYEVHRCIPTLRAQLALIRPRVIVTVGKHATWYISNHYGPLGALIEMGNLSYDRLPYRVPVYPVYHPAYLLRLGTAGKNRMKETVGWLKTAREEATRS